MHDVFSKCSFSPSFCHLHSYVLGVDRCFKRQTLFKCHESQTNASNARKPLVGGREPHLCSRPFGLELRPFKPRAYRDSPPLLSNLTTGRASRTRPHCPHLQMHPQTRACLHSNVRMRSVNASRCAFTETFSSAHLCCAAYAYNCFLSLSLANCGQQTAGGTGRAAGCHTGV